MHTTIYVKLVSTTNPKKSTLLKLEGLAAQDVAGWMQIENFVMHHKGEGDVFSHCYAVQSIIPSGEKV